MIGSRAANVLTLRTGWGINRSYSRAAVARMLHVSLKREGQLEHKAVSAMGSAAKRGSCSSAQQANRSALFLSPSELSLLGTSFPRAFVSSASQAKANSAVKAHHSAASHHKSSVSAASTGGVPGSIPSLAHSGTSSFPWLFIVIGIVLATALASPLARRRWLHPRTAGDTIPAPPPRRPGSGVSRRVAERAGAVGAAAAAGAAGLRSRRKRARSGIGRQAPQSNGGPIATPDAATSGGPAAPARAPAAEAGTAALGAGAGAAALGAGTAAAGAGALASRREREREREREEPRPDGDPAAASGLGARLEREGDVEGAIAAYRRADAGGDATGSTNLGVILEQRGDLEGAVAAYRRADERGDANGSFNLGCLLADLGDVTGALHALKRADQRGDPAGSSNLGVLLEQQGDADGALAAYRRADERGDANGSFNLGLLLANRGDMDGAQEAYQRAVNRGDPSVVERARSALAELTENDRGLGNGRG